MDLATAFWYAGGLIILLLALQVLAVPLELAVKVLGNSLLGGAALWVINFVGRPFDLHLALNPVSAAMAGMLGVPGVACLGIMRLIFSP